MNKHFGVTALATVAAIAILAASAAMPAQDAERSGQEAMATFLLRGYRDYLESFQFAQAKMVMSRAEAATVEDALVGNWLPDPPPVVADVLWAFDTDHRRYDQIYDPRAIERTTERVGGREIRHYESIRQVTSQSLEIYHVGNNTPILARKGEHTYPGWDPLNLNVGPSLADDPPQRTLSYRGKIEHDGRTYEILRSSTKYGPALQFLQHDDWWIDPEGGFRAARVETFEAPNTDWKILTVAQKFQECPNGQTLPTRVLQVIRFKEKGILWVKELKVLSFDVEHPPAADFFRLDFERGHRLINQFTNQTLLMQSGHIDLDWFSTDGMVRDGVTAVDLHTDTTRPAIPTAANAVPQWPFAGSNGKSVLLWTCVVIGSIAAIGAVLIRLRRHRS